MIKPTDADAFSGIRNITWNRNRLVRTMKAEESGEYWGKEESEKMDFEMFKEMMCDKKSDGNGNALT